jgi:hypothetical protein
MIFDVQQPASPRRLYTDLAWGGVYQIIVNGDRAYTNKNGISLQVFDISNPRVLQPLGEHSIPSSSGWFPVIDSGYAYVASGGDGLRVLDVRQPDRINEVPIVYAPGEMWEMQVQDTRVCVAGINRGVHVFDVSNPTQPQPRFQLLRDWTIYNVAVDHDLLFTSGYTRTPTGYYGAVRIFDLSGTGEPQFLADYVVTSEVGDLTVADNRLYIAGGEGFEIVDVSAPANPVLLWSSKNVNPAALRHGEKVQVEGDRVYLQADGQMYIIDATAPANPKILGIAGRFSAFQIVGYTHYFVVNSVLFIENIQDPRNPVFLARFDLPEPISEAVIEVEDDYAYIGAISYGNNYLYVVDVSDPTKPTLYARSDTQPAASGIVVANGQVYASSYFFGLFIYNQQGKTVTPTSSAQPLPTTPMPTAQLSPTTPMPTAQPSPTTPTPIAAPARSYTLYIPMTTAGR